MSPADLLGAPVIAPVEARVFEHPAVTRQRYRARLTALINRLIAMLDDIDGDPDLEDTGDDEPSLSAAVPVEAWQGSQDAWLQGPDDDREEACEDEGAEHDGREPEEDNDTSDLEASLCGVTFGIGAPGRYDHEANTAPFAMDQTPACT